MCNAPLRQGLIRGTYLNRTAGSICTVGKIMKFAFVQLFKMIGRDSLATYDVDDTNECIRLSWYRQGEMEGGLEPAKTFHMYPIDSVRFRIHISTGHDMVVILSNNIPCKAGLSEVLGDDSSRSGEWLYPNRFLRGREEQFPIHDEADDK